ncbi:MAG: leucine-rich repeat protein [Oscillospiraceae bacterium]|nr:leucine-rich repeat protein [Oscillospiraceae bacterium]
MSFDDGFILGLGIGRKLGGGGGTSDEWQFPTDWIDIPDPESNQIVMLMDTSASLNTNGGTTMFGCYDDSGRYGGVTIDCGDGQVIEIPEGTGQNFQYGYSIRGQYIITVTSNNIDAINFSGISYSDYTASSLRAIKVGANMHLVGNAFESSLRGLTYAEFFGQAATSYYGLYNLQCIKAHTAPSEIKSSCFSSCYNLRYIYGLLDEITTLPSDSFYSCSNLKKISLPNLTAMNGGVRNCQSLEVFSAPKLNAISNANDFIGCYSLKKLQVAEGCTYNNSFSDCPILTLDY